MDASGLDVAGRGRGAGEGEGEVGDVTVLRAEARATGTSTASESRRGSAGSQGLRGVAAARARRVAATAVRCSAKRGSAAPGEVGVATASQVGVVVTVVGELAVECGFRRSSTELEASADSGGEPRCSRTRQGVAADGARRGGAWQRRGSAGARGDGAQHGVVAELRGEEDAEGRCARGLGELGGSGLGREVEKGTATLRGREQSGCCAAFIRVRG